MQYIDTPMFVVLVRYIQPEAVVERFLAEHRAFIESCYEAGYFVVSGGGANGDPGVIIATGLSKNALREVLKRDAFCLNSVATHEILEFHGSRARDSLAAEMMRSSRPRPA
ncbi:GTP cyclohydrolase [Burkholderia cenocepacia]|uniref:YciI family protein n=1 Tax=Burkholderia cenocepacia TaxID=95486 RepID=UPI00285BADA2|nr:YciI family protein [Burkholderia cenocepacia]MDR8105000.1 GTP cyclohydrolase [Burkholderia cenocepacia]